MAIEDNTKQADQIKQEGNNLYKSGKINEAIQKYRKASELAPEQSAPLANLAAAYFESGKYQQSNDFAGQALSLLDQNDGQNASTIRLRSRMARAHMFLRQYTAARDVLALLPQPLEGDLLNISTQIRNLDTRQNNEDSNKEVILPIAQVYLSDAQPQIVGQDKPSSLFDTSLLGPDREDLSFLFAEVGDARNLFSTLIHLADPALNISKTLRFQFTATDRNAAVIARNLLLLLLLDEAAKDPASPALVAVYYLYIAPIIPADIYEIIRKKIESALMMLEASQALPNYIEIPEEHSGRILETLKIWLKVPSKINMSLMRQAVVKAQEDAEHKEEIAFFPARLKKEAIFYQKCGVLLAESQDTAKSNSLVEQFHSLDLRDAIDEVTLTSLDQNLKPNVTLFDASHFEQSESNSWPQLNFEPFEFGSKISAGEISAQAGLFDVVVRWIRRIAGALHSSKQKIKIQLVPTDPTSFLIGESAAQSFDRIHLSDLPDSTGGLMYVSLVGSALRYNQASYITWKTTIHAKKFKDWRAYDAASLALPLDHTPQDIDALFQIRIDQTTYAEDAGSFLFEKTLLSGYRRARRSGSGQISLDRLMPREKVESWLQRVVTRTNPFSTSSAKSKTMVPYLNGNMVFLLLNRLFDIGYPAHWLNETVSQALSAKTYETPATKDESGEDDKELARAASSVDAHLARIAWRDGLSFGVISPIVELGVLESYSIDIRELVRPSAVAVVVLRFSKNPASQTNWSSSTTKTESELDKAVANGEDLVLTAFELASNSSVISFVLDHALYKALQQHEYGISVWNVSTSTHISKVHSLADDQTNN